MALAVHISSQAFKSVAVSSAAGTGADLSSGIRFYRNGQISCWAEGGGGDGGRYIWAEKRARCRLSVPGCPAVGQKHTNSVAGCRRPEASAHKQPTTDNRQPGTNGTHFPRTRPPHRR